MSEDNRFGEAAKETGTLTLYWQECNWCNYFGVQIGNFE